MRVLSGPALRALVDRAASIPNEADDVSQAARARLAVRSASAEDAAARAEKLIGPASFRKPV